MEASNDATYSDSFGVEHILKKKVYIQQKY